MLIPWVGNPVNSIDTIYQKKKREIIPKMNICFTKLWACHVSRKTDTE